VNELGGRTVIVTRAADRGSALTDHLRELGADVMELPLTRTEAPSDGGSALKALVARLPEYDWIVVTSPEGARRFAEAVAATGIDLQSLRAHGLRLAAVGEATGDALGGADLVPNTQTGESLGDEFPEGPGRVGLAVAEGAGRDFEDRARDKGWVVDRVTSYRTVPIEIAPAVYGDVAHADAVAFASSSAVESWVAVFGTLCPRAVVAIGPSTADTARRLGLAGVHIADDHSIAGLARAVARVLG
jgi:uroporphyrinogen-III synthase